MTSTMRFDKWENSLGQPYGAVLQVVQNFVTTQTSYGAGEFTLFSLSIIPKMPNSKLYVMGHVSHGFPEIGNNNDGYDIGLVLKRGVTLVGNSVVSLRTGGTFDGPAFYATDVPANSESTYGFGYEVGQKPFAYLDSPSYSLGETITYNVTGKFQAGGWVNRSYSTTNSGGVSQITIMEIAQ
jgi:hypothetical protein